MRGVRAGVRVRSLRGRDSKGDKRSHMMPLVYTSTPFQRRMDGEETGLRFGGSSTIKEKLTFVRHERLRPQIVGVNVDGLPHLECPQIRALSGGWRYAVQ